MSETRVPEKVHFVGSIALDTVEEVFREVGSTCGTRLRRVPDGEPGGRRLWISWQWPLLRANAYLSPADGDVPASGQQQLRLGDGVDPAEIHFGELGYAREARASYEDFLAARERGDLPQNVKFQVALPTPFAVISPFVVPQDIEKILPAYAKAMFEEVGRICDAIPHDDLAIQWDVCIEMVIWDGQPSVIPPIPHAEEVVKAALAPCLAAVPADVEMGIHLCYGDWDAHHFIEPQDAGKEVSLANAIVELSPRPVNWMHLPVPANRDDDAFYAPLADLKLGPETELYLGLVHADGRNDARIAAASKVVEDFGIATECGIARQRTPDQVRELIRAHAASSREPAAV
jgi:hypothetical protein